MKDPEIGDELEELSAVKEIFLTDYRIMPLSKGSSNAKPSWVEGQSIGKDEEVKTPQKAKAKAPEIQENKSQESTVQESVPSSVSPVEQKEDSIASKQKDELKENAL